MSFKSILQEMKGEFGSISRKGFDLGYGFRSRSHRVVQEDLELLRGLDALKQSCWANMPPELLRDVLMRIEEADSMWPSRKNVVACAGVCRSWRKVTKEIVNTPEMSGKLTFPISLKQVVVILFCLRCVMSCLYTYVCIRVSICYCLMVLLFSLSFLVLDIVVLIINGITLYRMRRKSSHKLCQNC